MTWTFIFFVVALILFALAALNVPSSKVNLGWAGMFFAALGWLWPSLPH